MIRLNRRSGSPYPGEQLLIFWALFFLFYKFFTVFEMQRRLCVSPNHRWQLLSSTSVFQNHLNFKDLFVGLASFIKHSDKECSFKNYYALFVFLSSCLFHLVENFLFPLRGNKQTKKMLLDKDWVCSMSHILYSVAFKYQKLHDLAAFVYGNHGFWGGGFAWSQKPDTRLRGLVELWESTEGSGQAQEELGRSRFLLAIAGPLQNAESDGRNR